MRALIFLWRNPLSHHRTFQFCQYNILNLIELPKGIASGCLSFDNPII